MEAVEPCNQTQVLTVEPDGNTMPVLRLRLERPRSDRRVVWREGTVDNEHMGKKKSKCCCIYKKAVAFGESSSEDDEECQNCYGHPEKRRKNRKAHDHGDNCSEEDEDGKEEAEKPASSSDVIIGDGIEQQKDGDVLK